MASNNEQNGSPSIGEDDEISQSNSTSSSTLSPASNIVKKTKKVPDATHGLKFESKLLTLFCIRALGVGCKFRLAKEREDLGGKFDDVIFQYQVPDDTPEGKHWRYRYLQAKHKQNETDKINATHLIEDNDKSAFSLPKYFRSFCKMRRRGEDIHDCIICTNIGFDLEDVEKNGIHLVSMNDQPEDILEFGPQEKTVRYKLNFAKDLRIKVLNEWPDIQRLAINLQICAGDQRTIDIRTGVFSSYHVALIKERVIDSATKKFHLDFVNEAEGLSDGAKQLHQILSERVKNDDWKNWKFKLNNTFGKSQSAAEIENSLPLKVSEEDIDAFLDKFVFVVNMPNEEQFEAILQTQDVSKYYPEDECKQQTIRLLHEISAKFSNKEMGYWLTSEEAKKILLAGVTNISREYQAELEKEVGFNKVAKKDMAIKLKPFLDSSKKFERITTPSPRHTAVKVISAIQQYSASISHLLTSSSQLQTMENAVRWKNILRLPNDASHLLLVVCDDGEQPLQDEHYANVFLDEEEKTKKNKVIVVSRKKAETADRISDEINYAQLDEFFKQKILSKTVSFQGENVSVGRLVGTEQEEVIDSVEEFLRHEGRQIKIPLFDTSRFEKSLYIKRRVRFAFDENFYAELANRLNCTVEKVRGECKISAQGQIEWLVEGKRREEIWNNIKNINDQTYGTIEEDGRLINDDKEWTEQPVVIICGVAGTGKSTLLSHYYSEIKKKNPECWVIRLNLVQHCDAILKLDRRRPDLNEFLVHHLRVVDNQCPFSRSLLNHRLETGDRIVFMFDGFDEISDECQEIAIQLMKVIQKKKGVQLYVTTRTHMAHHLQYELNQLAYYLENFNENDQICYLASHWTSESQLPENGAIMDFAEALVDRVSETLKDKEKALIGIPLQCKILAECYQQNVGDIVRNNDVTLQSGELVSQKLLAVLDSQKFDLISLYSQLMDTKRKVFREEKTNTPNSNQIVDDAIGFWIKKIESRLTKLAVEIIITEPNVLEIFWPRKFSHKSSEDLYREEKILAENSLKFGLTFSCGDGMRPEFLHRTFAEYLVAKHLYEGFHLDDKRHNKLLENESIRKLILNKILASKQYDGVQVFFDCMVKHVVNEDEEWRNRIDRRQLPDRLKKWTENLFTQFLRNRPPSWAICNYSPPKSANALNFSLFNGKGNIFLFLCDCLDATFERQQIYWAMYTSFIEQYFSITLFKENKLFKRFINYFDIDPADSFMYSVTYILILGSFRFGSPEMRNSFWNRDEHQQTKSDLLQFLEKQLVAFNKLCRAHKECSIKTILELLICSENCRIHLATFLKLLSKTTAYSDDIEFAKLLMKVFHSKDHQMPGQIAKTLDVLHGLGRSTLLVQLYGPVITIKPEAFQNIYQPRRLENVDAIPADLDNLLERDPYGMTCLHGAAFYGDVEILDEMLARFGQLEFDDEAKQAVWQVVLEDYTPFYFAAAKCHENVCSSLLVFVKDMFPDALTATLLKGFIRRSLYSAIESKNVEVFQLILKVVKKELGHEYLLYLLMSIDSTTPGYVYDTANSILYSCWLKKVFNAMAKIIVDRDGIADYKYLYDLIFRRGTGSYVWAWIHLNAEHLQGVLSVKGTDTFTKRVLGAPHYSTSDDFRLLSKTLRNFNRTQLLDFVKTITLEPATENDDGTITVHAERPLTRNSFWGDFLRRTMEISAFSSPSREDVDYILECLTCVSDQLGGDCAQELLLHQDDRGYVVIGLPPETVKLMLERLPKKNQEEVKQKWKENVAPISNDSFFSFYSTNQWSWSKIANYYSDVLQFYLDYGSEIQLGQCVDILTSVCLIYRRRHSVWSFIFEHCEVTKTNELLKSLLIIFGRDAAKKLLLHEVDRFPVILKALPWREDIDGRLETLPQEIRNDIQQVVERKAVQLIDEVFLHHEDYFNAHPVLSMLHPYYKLPTILIFVFKYGTVQQLERFVENITTWQVYIDRDKTLSIWAKMIRDGDIGDINDMTKNAANMNMILKCVWQRLGTHAVNELVLHQIDDHPAIYYPAVRGEEKMVEAMLAHLDAENREEIQRQVNEFLDKTFEVPSYGVITREAMLDGLTLTKDGQVDPNVLAKWVRQASLRGLSGEDAAKLAAYKLIMSQEHSKAWYRIGATRVFSGSKKVQPQLSMKLKEVYDAINEHPETENLSPLSDNTSKNKAIIAFHAIACAVPENIGKFPVRIVRSGRTDNAVSVRVETIDGSAVAVEDYVAFNQVVYFEPHEVEKKLIVDIVDDNIYEPDEQFYLKLSLTGTNTANHEEVLLGRISIMEITILNDDEPGTITFGDRGIIVKESVGLAQIPVLRTNGWDGDVSVRWRTLDKKLKSGKTYKGLEGELVFKHAERKRFIEIAISNDMALEKDECFEVELFDPSNGAVLGHTTKLAVTITNDEEFNSVVDRLADMTTATMDSMVVHNDSWTSQIKDAMNVNGGDIENATTCDYVMHFLTFGWKIIFAFVPPAGIWGGWLSFVVSLGVIGILTAIVGDLAGIFGCLVGLDDAVTAITFVALGTSLPDLFASRTAAINEKYADNAIGNVTGSNSVNVFLGLGLPWLIASIYHTAKGGEFRVQAGSLGFSITIFTITAVLSLALLVARRCSAICGRGELGGPLATRYASAIFLLVLWMTYILLSSLETYGHIEGF
ncbi:hypothetical protein GHT06_014575 [Daphnia sinensis]|uniref:NACHT domain-containing protein n=1 Tax=Daphnia sinensis TaxID=1820382 RepID=A0AAD5KQ34_9CRUS|nr:hypothetical protein GHT06_014575 [Daphnia sinensis]